MPDEAKKARLQELSKLPGIARMDHRLVKGRNPAEEGLNRHQRRKLRKQTDRLLAQYYRQWERFTKSGAGYPADQLLRQFANEYNNRFLSSGTETQPVSFRYVEPFLEIELFQDVAPCATLRPEKDHLFDLQDFLDFKTSSDSPEFELTELFREIQEGVVYHYSCIGDVQDFTLLSPDGGQFAVSGFSIVRHESRVHWIVLGGEILNDERWGEFESKVFNTDISTVSASKKAFVTEFHEQNAGMPNPAVPLEGTTQSLRTVLTGETDLVSAKHIDRCYMFEQERSFNVISDDPETLGLAKLSVQQQETLSNQVIQIERAGVLWNLAECLFGLPAYFKFKFSVVRNTSASEAAKLSTGHVERTAQNTSYSKFKIVSAIEIKNGAKSTLRRYTPPKYNVEIDGHWRQLPFGQTGKGPNNEDIVGRTWIKAHHRWRERPERPRDIYLKSSIAAARIRAQSSDINIRSEQVKKPSEQSQKSTPVNSLRAGELYVMRCPIMSGEVYKIGWTSKSARERAEELSSQTGVPMSFIVVESWANDDAHELEKSVHVQLARYRINKRREFFKVPYDTIRRVIVSEIERQNTHGLG